MTLSNHPNYVIYGKNSAKIRDNWMRVDCYGEIEDRRVDNWNDVYRWIEDNIPGRWAVYGLVVYFENYEDALQFKLGFL